MITELSEEAIEYGLTARKVLESAGGDRLAQLAEAEPERRDDLVAPVLAELGAWELDPRSGADEAEAAAALCRTRGTGRWRTRWRSGSAVHATSRRRGCSW